MPPTGQLPRTRPPANAGNATLPHLNLPKSLSLGICYRQAERDAISHPMNPQPDWCGKLGPPRHGRAASRSVARRLQRFGRRANGTDMLLRLIAVSTILTSAAIAAPPPHDDQTLPPSIVFVGPRGSVEQLVGVMKRCGFAKVQSLIRRDGLGGVALPVPSAPPTSKSPFGCAMRWAQAHHELKMTFGE